MSTCCWQISTCFGCWINCVVFNTLAATPPHGWDTLHVHRQPHGVGKFFKWDFCQSYCRSCHAQGRRQKYGHSLTFWCIMASNSFGQGTISTINCLGRCRVFPCDAWWYCFLEGNLIRNCCNYSKCFTLDPTDAPLQDPSPALASCGRPYGTFEACRSGLSNLQ